MIYAKDPSEEQCKDIEKARYKLIETIAINLGYKDKLTWDEIQSFYLSRGMDESLKNQQDFQNMQTQIGRYITNQVQNTKIENDE